MSGIYIHGMEMPKDKAVIEIHPVGGYACTKYGFVIGRVIELPPHGRLGDLDALMAEFEQMQKLNDTRGHEFACSFMSSGMEISTEWYCVEDAVNAAKTIIPADQEGGSGNV